MSHFRRHPYCWHSPTAPKNLNIYFYSKFFKSFTNMTIPLPSPSSSTTPWRCIYRPSTSPTPMQLRLMVLPVHPRSSPRPPFWHCHRAPLILQLPSPLMEAHTLPPLPTQISGRPLILPPTIAAVRCCWYCCTTNITLRNRHIEPPYFCSLPSSPFLSTTVLPAGAWWNSSAAASTINNINDDNNSPAPDLPSFSSPFPFHSISLLVLSPPSTLPIIPPKQQQHRQT